MGAYDFSVDPLNEVSPNSNLLDFKFNEKIWNILPLSKSLEKNRTKQNALRADYVSKCFFAKMKDFPKREVSRKTNTKDFVKLNSKTEVKLLLQHVQLSFFQSETSIKIYDVPRISMN